MMNIKELFYHLDGLPGNTVVVFDIMKDEQDPKVSYSIDEIHVTNDWVVFRSVD